MIKNKEATDSAAVEFCLYFEQIADSPNFLRKLALKFGLRPKSLKLRHSSNWAANLFKIWQNSNALRSVAYFRHIYEILPSQIRIYRSNIPFKYCPVYDSSTSHISSGVPAATTVPPPAPPSGPMSII